ncbi:MAG: aspartate aminotransferase family protein [Roseovarius sp.]|uniref:aspartate aminotransferase family protein n=1 Tax=Roseovarius sp. TaxID=1486281 RepID=UPI0032ECF2FE
MSHVFPRHTRLNAPVATGGEGCYLIDAAGKRYLDASGGAAVSCLGHNDAGIIAAVKAQLDQIAFAHTGFFTSEPAEQLADLLIANAPGDLDRVYYVTGGSEATEAAIKLARQYWVEKGQPQRSRLISRKQSYHGNTIGALSAGGNEWRRAQFGPLLLDVTHIDPCYEYRLRHEGESLEAYGQRAAQALEDELLRVGPENVMAFMAEPVVGATAGTLTPAPGYFKRIREICDQYDILLILDEVMCGMGRTGTLFACEQDGIAPDITCIAKGLGAGYQPIGAMLCSAKIYKTIEDGTGFFQHGHTYNGHPTACAAGLAVVSAILDRGLLPRVRAQGEKLMHRLADRFGQHPHIGDLRGRGLFHGIEIVADRETKDPFDPSLGISAKIKKAAFAEGLVCYPMSGTIDGKHGDHVMLAPPFIISDAQLDELTDKLESAIEKAIH